MPTTGPDLSQLSISQLAELVGKDRRTVTKLLRGLVPLADGGRSKVYGSRAALERIYLGVERLDVAEEQARLARARAEAQELKNREALGELLPRDACIRMWSLQYTAFKHSLRAIPGKALVRIPGFTKAMARALATMLDEALDELAGDGLPRR